MQPMHGRPAFGVIDDENDSTQVEAARRCWPDALTARYLLNGTSLTCARPMVRVQLTNLRRWTSPRDAINGWGFAERLEITGELAVTLNRMFYGTNFQSVDDEWAWKHLFEAGMASVPPFSAS